MHGCQRPSKGCGQHSSSAGMGLRDGWGGWRLTEDVLPVVVGGLGGGGDNGPTAVAAGLPIAGGVGGPAAVAPVCEGLSLHACPTGMRVYVCALVCRPGGVLAFCGRPPLNILPLGHALSARTMLARTRVCGTTRDPARGCDSRPFPLPLQPGRTARALFVFKGRAGTGGHH